MWTREIKGPMFRKSVWVMMSGKYSHVMNRGDWKWESCTMSQQSKPCQNPQKWINIYRNILMYSIKRVLMNFWNNHTIELTPGTKPVNCKVYPLNLDEQKALDEFLEENLWSRWICPLNSPMASPFFFVKKNDDTLWPVQDYQKLNNMTIKNCYPLPLIQELIDKL